jgi:hypothetical protein
MDWRLGRVKTLGILRSAQDDSKNLQRQLQQQQQLQQQTATATTNGKCNNKRQLQQREQLQRHITGNKYL